MRFYPDRLYYSFAVQLVVMHLKKNQLILLYWVLVFGFITQAFANRFGIPYLFLDPEYLGKVDFLSFFLVGIASGVFIMAFNISSYILNSFRFPFLATLSRTFQKYTLNNFVIPALFVVVYVAEIIAFQYFNQFKSIGEIALYIAGFLAGIFTVISLTLRYFLLTNKDIYKLFGVEHADAGKRSGEKQENEPRKTRGRRKKGKNSKAWRVETYLSFPWHTRLVRSTEHYKQYMLHSVFKQNHINAAVMEIIVFSAFILLGLFREFDIFQIPAAASILLLFTMFIMLSGVARFWLRSWASSALIALFLVLNYFSQFEFFNQRNKAIGLDYTKGRQEYSMASIENALQGGKTEGDKNGTITILNKWKNRQGTEKPKLVVMAISGGGLRSSLFTFRTFQALDSVLDGGLMEQTRLITGSSGGLIGAAYYRGIYLERPEELSDKMGESQQKHLDNIATDLLNTTAFSFTVSDLFMNMQSFRENGNIYYKDRGYAFEKQLNKNLGQVLNRTLGYYKGPEERAEIPMMVISPTIINDGRSLMISPVGVSYLLQQPTTGASSMQPVADGIEYTSFFSEYNPYNTRFSSILRMNATFPYIMPAASLPTEPSIEVMDAGVRDNYGIINAVRFIYEFRGWIRDNTSGVVLIQIRDTNKRNKIQNTSLTTLLNKITSPLRNVSGNFILMQDYVQDDHLRYLEAFMDCPVDFIPFQLPQMDEKIALSWHLTKKEKLFLKNAVYTQENLQSLKKAGALLGPASRAAGIAAAGNQ
jgi:hypothetical protein